MFRMKSLFLVALLAPLAMADEMPQIVGTIPNDVGGSIIFTTSPVEECKQGELFVYTKDRTGMVGLAGCYNFFGEDIVVRYFDNTVYSYSIQYLQLNPEFERYLKKQEQQQRQQQGT